MKQKISRSLLVRAGIEAAFDVAVSRHAHDMRNWRSHMKSVRRDENAGVPLAERSVAYPAPRAHELVEAAVNEKDEADFEIVEDGPSPEQILDAQKRVLLVLVNQVEQLAIERVTPVGKRRLFNMRESDIRRADAARARSLAADHAGQIDQLKTKHEGEMAAYRSAAGKHAADERQRGILGQISAATGFRKPPPAPAPPAPPEFPPQPDSTAIEAERSPEDTRHLEEQQQRRDRIAAIERLAAQAHHDIEDLTTETIGSWSMPDFN